METTPKRKIPHIHIRFSTEREPVGSQDFTLSGEVDRLWPDGVPQIRNEHGSAYVTGYTHDDASNLIYLGMVGHKTVLDSIRATV